MNISETTLVPRVDGFEMSVDHAVPGWVVEVRHDHLEFKGTDGYGGKLLVATTMDGQLLVSFAADDIEHRRSYVVSQAGSVREL